jgi:nitrous oxidase accessory protein NosD
LLNIFLNIDNVVDNVCLYAGSETTEAVASAGITVAGGIAGSLVTALSSPAVIAGLVVLGIGMGVGAAYYAFSGVTETAATTATTFVEINNITDAIGL